MRGDARLRECEQQGAKAEQQQQFDGDADKNGGTGATGAVLVHAEADEQGIDQDREQADAGDQLQ